MSDSAQVDALVSGWEWPAGQTVTYSFETGGAETDRGPYAGGSDTTSYWNEMQKDWVREVYDQISAITGTQFQETAGTASSDVDFQLVENVPGGWAGYADYPSTFFGSTVVIGVQWVDPAYGNTTVHEIGHSMGLEHPHDGAVFPGVSDAYDMGDHDLNNALFTTMSYNSAYDPLHPDLYFNTEELSFMAFDIAALQEIYGVNMNAATGDDMYGMTTRLSSIWDAGGEDAIDFGDAIGDAVIDLRAATLENAPGGGGYLSFVYDPDLWYDGTDGGYTIANGVIIENAYGGAGNDEITGNDAANLLKGNAGDDILLGLAGDDTLSGSNGADDLDGGDGKDLLKGAKGKDTLSGGKGKDDLQGGANRDTLKGGQKNDTLDGGEGNDKLKGGGGDDHFQFDLGGGDDKLQDFEAGDVLELDAALWTGNRSAGQVVDDFASTDGDDILLSFDDGDSIRVKNILPDFANTDAAMAAIEAAIDIV